MNKKLNIVMLMMLIGQYFVPIGYFASDVYNIESEAGSEAAESIELDSEIDSEIPSEVDSELVTSEVPPEKPRVTPSTRKLVVVNGTVTPGYYQDDIISYEQVALDMGFEIISDSGSQIIYEQGNIDTSVAGTGFQQKITVSEQDGETKEITLKYNVYNGAIPPDGAGFADKGDAPASYGNPTIYTDVGTLGDVSTNPSGFYLGMDAAFFDETDDNNPVTANGLDDDLSSGDGQAFSSDDETGFLYTFQNSSGQIEFDTSKSTIYLRVPYSNTDGLSGQIGLWFDFDKSGTFDSDEFYNAPVTTSAVPASRTFGAGNEAFRHNAAEFAITVPANVSLGSSYMRAVMTTDTGDISELGNDFDMSKGQFIGEIEDYPVLFTATSVNDICYYGLPDDPALSWTSVEYGNARAVPSVVNVANGYDRIKYIGIPGPFGEVVDLEITLIDRDFPDDSIAVLTDATQYQIDPDGLVYEVFNDNRGDQVHVTMSAYLTGTDQPTEIPIQARIYGFRSKGEGRAADNIEILNIEPDPADIWFESDTILDHDADDIWPTSITDNQAYEGSPAVAAYIGGYATTHEFDLNIDYHGGVGVSLGWPTSTAAFECKAPQVDTNIEKTVADSSGDGAVSSGEVVTYQIAVTNPGDNIPAIDVPVRDSLLENLPAWITYNDDVTLTPSEMYSGDLTAGDFTIHQIAAGQTVTITYSLTIGTIPNGTLEINNIATDTVNDPTSCPPELALLDCDEAVIPVTATPTITKAITAESGDIDSTFEYQEDLTYTISISNNNSVVTDPVIVRDSLFENMPAWITVGSEPVINPETSYISGTLATGDLLIDKLEPGQTVTITYTLHIGDIPADVAELNNIVTIDGQDPNTITDCLESNSSCSEVTIAPETIIEKSVTDASGDNQLSLGEQATYAIKITNPSASAATDVVVRDSLYEQITSGAIDFASIVSGPVLNPDLQTTGDLGNGTFTILSIPSNSSVTISFTVVYNTVPTNQSAITSLLNIATDNGSDPAEITDPQTECPPADDDCATASIPLLGDTTISKELILESITSDQIAERGEELTYQITISNPYNVDSLDVHVRDSVLENLASYDWISVKPGSVAISPEDTSYSGDPTKGELVIDTVPANSEVVITYTLVIGDYPSSVTSLANAATDNNTDPETCSEDNQDCSSEVIDLNPNTSVSKELTSESINQNGIIEVDEDLTYTITVTNDSDLTALNVPIRDNLLEDLPVHLSWDNILTIDPATTVTTGSLTDGNFIITSIEPNSVITLTYTLHVESLPSEVTLVGNIVTDNGADPVLPCLPSGGDCAITINPTQPETVIYKSVSEPGDDGIVETGDTLTYQIEVKNPTQVPAPDTLVRDSLVEAITADPNHYLTYNDDLVISDGTNQLAVDVDYLGDLTTADLEILNIPANSSVYLTYSVTVDSIPDDLGQIINVVTDNGSDPTICSELSTDCSGTITEVDPETVITKTSSQTEAAQIGDVIDYQVTITNPNQVATAYDVMVSDSLVANLPPYLSLVSIAINPADTIYSSVAASGNITIASIAPGQSVTIDYQIEVLDIPNDVADIINIATDNGGNPSVITPEVCAEKPDDCSVIVTPVDPETLIAKQVVDANGDGIVEAGEQLNYTIEVTNPGSSPALDVNVSDKLVDDITGFIARLLGDSSYLTYGDDLVLSINGTPLVIDQDYSGDLATGDLVINSIPADSTVSITFSITVDSIPDDVTAITNIVADNGESVESCAGLASEDCDTATIVTNPKTIIGKSVTDSSGDGLVAVGETFDYTVSVYNPSSTNALNIIVKDSVLSNLPDYIEVSSAVTVTPTTTVVSGDLTSSDGMTIAAIESMELITITYSLRLVSNPTDDALEVINIVTDDGTDPSTLTPEVCITDSEDCATTQIPIDADTEVSKSLIAESGALAGTAENGELLTYQIEVTNPTSAIAYDVNVKDSLLSNLPSYMELEGDISIANETTDLILDTDYTGSLQLADGIIINQIAGADTVTITYSVRIDVIPDNVAEVGNIVTDNGDDPTTCSTSSSDCDGITIPVEVNPLVTKKLVAEDGEVSNVAENGETLTFELDVINSSIVTATDVIVRDSLIEAIENGDYPWISYNGIISTNPSPLGVTGDLSLGTYTITEVPGQTNVTITYSITIGEIPNDVGQVANIVTDNGDDPSIIDICDETDRDCDLIVLPIKPETIINKAVDAGDDNIVSVGEQLNYTVTVENPSVAPANDVVIKDSLLANIPGYMTYNNDLVVTENGTTLTAGTDYTVSTGQIAVNTIAPNSQITITYSMTLDSVPEAGLLEVTNIVTDNGDDPSLITDPQTDCPPEDGDCATATVPLPGDTTISKELILESITNDQIAERGEELTYQITITNADDVDSLDVHVRDSVLENLASYDWISVKPGSVSISPEDTSYSGDPTKGELVIDTVPANSEVVITYTLVIGDYPSSVTSLANAATDNNTDPETCSEDNEDCSSEVIDLNPKTSVSKELTSESINQNGIIEVDEDLTYTITVTNDSDLTALNVPIRDNLLEDLPVHLSWDNILTIDPATTVTTGSLTDGDFIITSIEPNSVVTLTYTLHVESLPSEVTLVGNIVTDNGADPVLPCLPSGGDCAITIDPTQPETVIYKSVSEPGADGIVEIGDTLTYQIEVKNPTQVPAPDTLVRDSLVEAITADPNHYLTYNDDLVISDGTNQLTVDVDYLGDLTTADLEILNIPANSSVYLTYSVTVDSIPDDLGQIINVVTDNGSDPTICSELSTDCSGTITEVDPETVITKTSSQTEAAKIGDVIDYQVTITNPNQVATAYDVMVSDSLVANLPPYLSLVSIAINPADTIYSSVAASGNITIASIAPGQSVTIDYQIEVLDIPNDVAAIINIATDNGGDPSVITPEVCAENPEDCSVIVTPVDPETFITKQVVDANGDGIVEAGEQLNYTIEVTNPGSSPALDVNVSDKLVDDITGFIARLLGDSSYLTYGDDLILSINGTPLVIDQDYSGDLATGDLVINSIPVDSTVSITFSITVDSIPDDVTAITNIVTDNGESVESCEGLASEDCDTATIITNPKTIIGKSVTDSNGDGLVAVGETFDYTVSVYNPSSTKALNIIVKDSVLSNLPDYIEISSAVTVTPATTVVSGDLTSSDGMTIAAIESMGLITITYSLRLVSNPTDDAVEVINIVTDDGTDPSTLTPEVCITDSEDCSTTQIPIDADTEVSKSLIAESGELDGQAENGELLTYQIEVTNPTSAIAYDVNVKDSLLSNLPSYMALEGDISIANETTDLILDTDYTGSLQSADGIIINQIAGADTVTITYSVRISTIPDNVAEVGNVVTDNGQDPNITLPNICQNQDDCSSVVIPIKPETIIAKTASDSNSDGYVSVGEEVTYTITVTNPSVVDSLDVVVRDSLYSNLPSYLEITSPFTVEGSFLFSPTYQGDLQDPAGITIDQINSGKTVTITYGLTLISVPSDNVTELTNIVTDDGSDPTLCSEISGDCGTTVTPIDADTLVSKALVTEDGAATGVAENGETLTFAITVSNNTDATATSVIVRDSLVEGIANDLYPWITYNGIISTSPSNISFSGDLSAGTYTLAEVPAKSQVVITYSITIGKIPNDVSQVANIVTDNGEDPSVITDCDNLGEDCSQVILPIKPETIVTKTASSGADNLVSIGEQISYTLTVTNPSIVLAEDVIIKDSLLINVPGYMTYNNDLSIKQNGVLLTEDIDYQVTSDGILLNEVTAESEVVITYSMTLDSIPDDGVSELTNIVTDNGQDPDITNPELCIGADCSEITVPIDADTVITKQLISESIENDLQAQQDEMLTYQITIDNPTDATAYTVEVKDSLLANLPEYVTLVSDITIDPVTTIVSGSLLDNDFVISQVPAKSTITITYTLLIGDVPSDLTSIGNIATDNGQDPSIVDPEECVLNDDCSEIVIPTNPETTITKQITNESIDVNAIAEPGETLTYQISVKNTSSTLSALDIPVKDSLIEQIAANTYPDYTYNGITSITPPTTMTTGNLEDGTFIIDAIEPSATVVIEYTVTLANPFTSGEKFIGNVVTDNGQDPDGLCESGSLDCDQVIILKEPDTLITKSVTVSGDDALASSGEILTYQVEISNPTNIPAENITFRDSLIEKIENGTIDYLQIVPDSLVVTPADTIYSQVTVNGDATGLIFDRIDPKQTVTITYQIKVLAVPDDVGTLLNIVTDDGSDPTSCSSLSPDCSATITETEPETIVTKSVSDNDGDMIAETGDVLTYQLKVSNPHQSQSSYDVVVRDSLLENLPAYLELSSETLIPTGTTYSGSLTNSGITITEVPASSDIYIEVVLKVLFIPDDISEIINIVTDNEANPNVIDPETCDEDEDCDTVVIPADADTTIAKSIVGESIEVDGLASQDEIITYQLKVSNNNDTASAYGVSVRDSLYEMVPSEMSIVQTFAVSPSTVTYSGDLADGSLVIDEIMPMQDVVITYQMQVNVIDGATQFANIATDNGGDPQTTCEPGSLDCSQVILPIMPDTMIEKRIYSESIYEDNLIEDYETIVYELDITNISSVDAQDVPVRDNVLENLSDYPWLTLSDVVVNPSDAVYSGSIEGGDFVIDVPVGQTVTIYYSLTADEVPSESKLFTNIATDDGEDPRTCSIIGIRGNGDCSLHVSLLEADTSVVKTAYDENNNGVIEDGESIRYTVDITNFTNIAAVDTPVRDSLLEQLPDYATAELITITDTQGNTLVSPTDYTGDLTDGDFILARIARRNTVSIIYEVTFDQIPDNVTEIANFVSTDGLDPEQCESEDPNCAQVIFPVEGDTIIDKAITFEGGEINNIIEDGETIEYQLSVKNPTINPAVNVSVRDSLLEDLPDYATIVGEIVVTPEVQSTGSLYNGDYVITTIAPGEEILINYSIKFTGYPSDVAQIGNYATDNGGDPEVCTTTKSTTRVASGDDCAFVIVPTQPDPDPSDGDGDDGTYPLTVTGGAIVLGLISLIASLIALVTIKKRIT